ncbi:hypothetical protein DL764_008782 [Monosporascus ibericus]|uniref:Fungal lipase-type domain-containing protein n=1 Tax=Monosporascus ibericus TaxID=155417 RepID=A0A4Q4SZG5_9PEZI|nr:hypothetical protein DL764_008782 [Monosporascus ibericus]
MHIFSSSVSLLADSSSAFCLAIPFFDDGIFPYLSARSGTMEKATKNASPRDAPSAYHTPGQNRKIPWWARLGIRNHKSVEKGLRTSGNVLGRSKSSGPSQHSAGASMTVAQASAFLRDFLTANDATPARERDLRLYLARVEKMQVHRIETTDDVKDFTGSEETSWLIRLAAEGSIDAYSDSPGTPTRLVLEGTGDFKKTVVSLQQVPNRRRVLVVAIRGSTTMMDWLVNGNGDPRKVSQAMDKMLRCLQTGPADGLDLIFTGHSAGGAIAKLFYAMSASPSHAIANPIPNFCRIHCLVFGAPPITTLPIPLPESGYFQSGLFLNIVNEGDPVPLMQPEYVKALLKFFTLNAIDLERHLQENYPNCFTVPAPVFRVSGSCIILRDNDCDNVDAVGWNAVTIRADKLERKLFGNPALHLKTEYLERVKDLTKDITR